MTGADTSKRLAAGTEAALGALSTAFARGAPTDDDAWTQRLLGRISVGAPAFGDGDSLQYRDRGYGSARLKPRECWLGHASSGGDLGL